MATKKIPSQRDIQRWIDQLKRAALLEHESDWLKAGVAREIYAFPADTANRFMSRIGKGAGPTKAQFSQMATAIEIVPDRDVWIAAGWRGVSKIVTLSKAEREKRISSLRKQAMDGKLPRERAAKILSGGKPQERKPAAPSAAQAERLDPTSERHGKGGLLDKALSDLAKLAAFNPGTLALLSDDVREAVEKRLKAEAA